MLQETRISDFLQHQNDFLRMTLPDIAYGHRYDVWMMESLSC
jgi:hypothetical protein